MSVLSLILNQLKVGRFSLNARVYFISYFLFLNANVLCLLHELHPNIMHLFLSFSRRGRRA